MAGPGGRGNSFSGSGSASNYSAGGGAGNPGGYSEKAKNQITERATTGTGGLLMIYAEIFNNQYSISSEGKNGAGTYSGYSYAAGGSSGGGSINIFYKNLIQKGFTSSRGGNSVSGWQESNSMHSGAGGNGTITFTEIN